MQTGDGADVAGAIPAALPMQQAMAPMWQVPSPGPETAGVRPPVQSCVIPATPFVSSC